MSESRSLKILLVDDEDNILRSLSRLLSAVGAEILTANSGDKALDLLRQGPVDVIMSDQRMPGMVGSEFLGKSREFSPDSTRILLTGHADWQAIVSAINDGAISYYFSKPWDDDVLLSRIRESLALHVAQSENKRLTELLRDRNKELSLLNADLDRRVEAQTDRIKQQHKELQRSFMETIKAFSTLVELRFQEVGSHSQRVAKISRKMALSLNLPEQDAQNVVVAAFLHDIGKIGLADSILQKKREALTQEDLDAMARHPLLGQSCLYHVSGFEEVAFIVRNHHENIDGSGYPDGLVDNQIPLGAKIIRIADAFDHEAFDRGYPNMMVINEASAHLVRYSGTLYNQGLVRLFIDRNIANDFAFDESPAHDVYAPNELQDGMIVAEDIRTRSGMFLLPKGARLSRGMIRRIGKMHAVDPIPRGIHVFKQNSKEAEVAKNDIVQNLVGR
jgi:response regulator RpfG family c-di-GMP phosphodiesterase